MTNEQIQAFGKEFNELFAKHRMMPSDLLNVANRYDVAPVIGAITGTLTTALAAYMAVIDCTVNVETGDHAVAYLIQSMSRDRERLRKTIIAAAELNRTTNPTVN